MPLASVLMPIKGDCPYLPIAIQSVRLPPSGGPEPVIWNNLIDESSSSYSACMVEMGTRSKNAAVSSEVW